MKLNTNRAKQSAIDTGAAVIGAVAAHAGTKFLTETLVEKSPDSSLVPHIPAIVLGATIVAQALDLIPANNDYLNSALLGAGVVSGMAVVREYTGANDDTKNTAGIALQVNSYFPALNGAPVWDNLPVTTYREPMPQALQAAGNASRLLGTPAQSGALQSVAAAFAQ